MAHAAQDAGSGQPDRKWPLLVTIAFTAILLFWAGYSYVQHIGQSAVEPEEGPVPPYTLSGKAVHKVRVSTPDGPPFAVATNPVTGQTAKVSCTSCHSTRTPNPAHGLSQALEKFHLGLTFQHGAGVLSCLSCHNSSDYDALRAANGDAIAYTDVHRLCAQCHSSQFKDYQHGAHGGMTGYWDLAKGGRSRHSCIDCHDPHAPAYPQMQPTFKPFDRGLTVAPDNQNHPSANTNHE